MRLMIYDDGERGPTLGLGLTHSWIVGGHLYKALGRLDDFAGARSWAEALDWIVLRLAREDRQLTELQIWSHGKWGCALMGEERLDADTLDPDHELHPRLSQLRELIAPSGALWWFRTCETLGADAGQSFACQWADFFNMTVAGHTHIIGPVQSGLHAVEPGASPDWSPTEGLIEGSCDDPRRAAASSMRARNSIVCLTGRIPASAIVRNRGPIGM